MGFLCVCVSECVPLHLCVFLLPFRWLFFFLSFLSLFVLSSFILLLSIRCLFSDENQKRCGFRWKERWGESLKELGRGNCNQNIMYGKNLF